MSHTKQREGFNAKRRSVDFVPWSFDLPTYPQVNEQKRFQEEAPEPTAFAVLDDEQEQ